jgi:hypothetical protein
VELPPAVVRELERSGYCEGSVSTLLEQVTEEAIGLDRLRALAARTLGDEPSAWHIGYAVWLGIK